MASGLNRYLPEPVSPANEKAILELVKRQAVVLVQKEAFGEIALRRHKRFEEVFAADETMAAIEQEYSK